MSLRQTAFPLGTCKAKGADGLSLGGDDRSRRCAPAAARPSAVRSRSSGLWVLSARQAPAGPLDYGGCHGGVQRLLLGTPSPAAMRSGSAARTTSPAHKRPERWRPTGRTAAPPRGRALHPLNWRFMVQQARLTPFFFHSLLSLKLISGFAIRPESDLCQVSNFDAAFVQLSLSVPTADIIMKEKQRVSHVLPHKPLIRSSPPPLRGQRPAARSLAGAVA